MKNLNLFSRTTKRAVAAALLFPLAFVLSCGNSNTTAVTPAGNGTGVGGLGRGPTPVNLGAAGNYRILAESAITNVPTSDVTGDVGLSPAAGSFIGISCVQVTGTIYQADATGAGCMIQDSGGLNLGPATYKWSSAVIIPTSVTLTGGPNDVWIFQIAQGLSISAGVQVILAGGALPENIYWAVFSAADLNTTSVFKGTLISQTGISMKTGATINGRLLAGTAVTLESNVVAP